MAVQSESGGTSPSRPEVQSEEAASGVEPDRAPSEDNATSQSVSPAGRTSPSGFTRALPVPSEEPHAYYRALTRDSSLRWIVASVIIGSAVVALVIILPDIPTKHDWIIGICVTFGLLAAYNFVRFLQVREKIESASEQEPSDDRARNQILINKYHGVARRQATISYINCQLAMLVGLALLVAGTIVAVHSKSESVQVVVGALTALSGALSAYLVRTFIRTYEQAVSQMKYYFGLPVVERYISEAERLSGQLTAANQDEALFLIITETLNVASSASRVLSPESQEQPVRRHFRPRRSGAGNGNRNGAAQEGNQP